MVESKAWPRKIQTIEALFLCLTLNSVSSVTPLLRLDGEVEVVLVGACPHAFYLLDFNAQLVLCGGGAAGGVARNLQRVLQIDVAAVQLQAVGDSRLGVLWVTQHACVLAAELEQVGGVVFDLNVGLACFAFFELSEVEVGLGAAGLRKLQADFGAHGLPDGQYSFGEGASNGVKETEPQALLVAAGFDPLTGWDT